MRRSATLLFLGSCVASAVANAQSLAPRAYVITPVGSNAVTLTYGYYRGNFLAESAAPIADGRGEVSLPILSFYHTFSFFHRSASITAELPYSVGTFSASLGTAFQSVYRSGLLDSAFRFSVNLKGGPAMPLKQFLSWRQKTLIGASVIVVAPTGQYDPARLVNQGTGRWAFKPELGLSRRSGRWILDAYAAGWFFTANTQYFPGNLAQTEKPIGIIEMHLSYDVKPRLWFSADGNFWYGGVTALNGIDNPRTLQRTSRVGVTGAIPISSHQSLKFSYSAGAHVRFGGDYRNILVAWQYAWVREPK